MADSPFLPGTNVQFAYDSTMLGNLKLCPQYYYLTHIEGWQPKEESVHLRFGQLYQQTVELYKREIAKGIQHNDAVHDVITWLLCETTDWWSVEDLGEMRGSAKKKTRMNLLTATIWRLDDYRDDPTRTYIMENGEPAVELSFRFELNWGPQSGEGQPYLLCGHLDEVVKFAGELYGLDNKTTSWGLSERYFDQYDPHNQMSLYTLATQVLLHVPVKGMIIDAVQVDGDKTKFRRGMTFRNQENLDEWVGELKYWFALQEQFALADKWPHNDMSCDKYGGCRFREVCTQSPRMRQRYLESAFVQLPREERWNPLKSRQPTSSAPPSSASPPSSELSAAAK